ncbi:MAG: hypothetical protein HOE53_02410 [Candidatus Magasanikbacteria bacterium]|jgi:hypothetical protein|nr:hypothetical protein [Candidatus Magasanikbacteria bacterium]
MKPNNKKAYVVTVDMGYGHQRASYPLHDMASPCALIPSEGESHIISANTYGGIPRSDRRKWEGGRSLYETVSRFKNIPLLGTNAFKLMNYLQRIEAFYPRRDLSKPIMQLAQIYKMIQKGWGKDLITKLNSDPLPYVTTFFSTAFMAEVHGYKGEIYCLCTDTDISRAWAPLDPKKSKIKYLAPNKRVRERLMLYGVKAANIFVTGFPLPKENIGTQKTIQILKETLRCRLENLDPRGVYHKKYHHTIAHHLGNKKCLPKYKHPLTITFAVGGAGAQKDLGIAILKSLHDKIDKKEVVLNLVAGSRQDVYRYFQEEVKRLHLEKSHGGCVNIIYDESKYAYFQKFNQVMLTTDLLWTKPSELSFYSALGIPVIMAPTIGSQEDFNREWLHDIGSGVEQEDPKYTHEWLFDWLDSGWLAQAAMEGYLDAPRNGAYHIEDIVLKGKRSEIEEGHLL